MGIGAEKMFCRDLGQPHCSIDFKKTIPLQEIFLFEKIVKMSEKNELKLPCVDDDFKNVKCGSVMEVLHTNESHTSAQVWSYSLCLNNLKEIE